MEKELFVEATVLIHLELAEQFRVLIVDLSFQLFDISDFPEEKLEHLQRMDYLDALTICYYLNIFNHDQFKEYREFHRFRNLVAHNASRVSDSQLKIGTRGGWQLLDEVHELIFKIESRTEGSQTQRENP